MAPAACTVVERRMIRPHDGGPLVYLCVEPVDGRKQINGLATLVQDTLQMNPFSEQLFVFSNRRRDRCRILYWERSGFVLWIKRLEKARFAWPRIGADDAVVTLAPKQLNLLLDGYNIWAMRPHEQLFYEVA
jgi:transposase